jgi:hypothetical protein
MKIGGGMASKYFLEERWNNIDVGQFQMGYSRVLGAPQTGSISMHVLLSFSPNPIWWDVILLMSCNC